VCYTTLDGIVAWLLSVDDVMGSIVRKYVTSQLRILATRPTPPPAPAAAPRDVDMSPEMQTAIVAFESDKRRQALAIIDEDARHKRELEAERAKVDLSFATREGELRLSTETREAELRLSAKTREIDIDMTERAENSKIELAERAARSRTTLAREKFEAIQIAVTMIERFRTAGETQGIEATRGVLAGIASPAPMEVVPPAAPPRSPYADVPPYENRRWWAIRPPHKSISSWLCYRRKPPMTSPKFRKFAHRVVEEYRASHGHYPPSIDGYPAYLLEDDDMIEWVYQRFAADGGLSCIDDDEN
jgi:hypothetical protein